MDDYLTLPPRHTQDSTAAASEIFMSFSVVKLVFLKLKEAFYTQKKSFIGIKLSVSLDVILGQNAKNSEGKEQKVNKSEQRSQHKDRDYRDDKRRPDQVI